MATTDETTDLPIFSINNGDKVIRVGLAGLELNNVPADTAFALSHEGIGLEYDITGTKKTFTISPNGLTWSDGTSTNTTGLERLSLVQQAFQAVQLPPNATTLQLNDTLLLTDGTNTNTLDTDSISFSNPTIDTIGSYGGNSFSLQTDATSSSVGSAGISASAVNSAGTLISGVSGGVVGMPSPPYPAPDANWSLSVNSSTSNPSLYLSKSAPFTNSTSLTIDLNNITHNQSTGSPSPDDTFTISTNKNISITADNFDLGTTQIVYPTLALPERVRITNQGITCDNTTGAGNSWWRNLSAFMTNTANTISTFIQAGLITITNTTLNSLGVYGADSLRLSKTGAENGSAELLGYGRLTNIYYGGGYTDYLLQMINANSGAGNTTGVVGMLFQKTGRNGGVGDIIMSQQYRAKNYLGTDTQFGKIESVITSSSAGAGDDGALDFYTAVNGTSSLVMRLNGADNENNSFRPLDMNGNAVKTTSGSMTIDATGSSGTGHIILNPKVVGGEIQVSKPITNPAGQIDLVASTNTNMTGFNNTITGYTSLNFQTPSLVYTGTALQSATSSGSAGTHLVITLNGNQYKIALLNP
jgi:hypothetical protein